MAHRIDEQERNNIEKNIAMVQVNGFFFSKLVI